MGRKHKELSTETKELIMKLHRKKERRSYISDLLDIPWSTIDSVVKKYRSTGTVENQPRKGRQKLFTAWDEVGLNRLVKKNRRAPLQEITTKLMTVNSIRSAVELSEGNLHLKVTNDELQNSVSMFAKSTVKRGWHGVGKDAAGLLIHIGRNIYILMKVR